MTIEQKVKAYDEAIEKARLVLQEKGNEPDGASILSELFPELAESEDERIRKYIVECVEKYGPANAYPERFRKMLAYLEKQNEQKTKNECVPVPCNKITDKATCGEHKPTDKIEPKFKVGDKVIPKNHQEESLTITKVTDTEYYSRDLLICKIDEQDKWELAEQDPCKDCTSPNCYFCEHNEHEEIKRMEEAMQNSEWSEEDEFMLESIIQTLKLTNGAAQIKIDWLKSLRHHFCDYHKGFKKGFAKAKEMHYDHWKPSDEQMKNK